MIRMKASLFGHSRIFRRHLFAFCKNKIVKTPQDSEQNTITIKGKEVLTEIPESELADIKQNTTNVPGVEDREFVSLTDLQKQIVQKKQFNLMDQRLNLQKIGISQIMAQNLTKIDLGQVDIKSKNQILLQNVDPENIPQDMDIVFQSRKRLTLVGKRIKKGESKGNMMKVQDASFQQKSLSEYRGEAFGVGKISFAFNRKQFLKFTFLLLPILFLIQPFFQAQSELDVVRSSIMQVQKQQIENVKRSKKFYYRKVLLQNPDFVYV